MVEKTVKDIRTLKIETNSTLYINYYKKLELDLSNLNENLKSLQILQWIHQRFCHPEIFESQYLL